MDFSSQFDRIKHASDRRVEFAFEFGRWMHNDDNYNILPEISPDRLEFKLVLKSIKDPPLTRWSFLFGEVVHHLRATLDNFAYEIAAQNTQHGDANLGKVCFPIHKTIDSWKKSNADSRTRLMPQPYRDAIYKAQPFMATSDGLPPSHHFLAILSILDNIDKHRYRFTTSLSLDDIKHSVHIKLATGETINTEQSSFVETFRTEFREGATLMRYTSPTRIETANLESHGYSLGLDVMMPDGSSYYTIGLLDILTKRVGAAITQIINEASPPISA